MIFIAGSTGFVGRHLVGAVGGRAVRCLVRRPDKAGLCKQGFEAAIGDITDKKSLNGKLEGVTTVVHLVGIIEEKGGMTFHEAHVEGTRNLVGEAVKSGVKKIFFQSALGADINSWAAYLRTKAEAENIVRESGIPYFIFRPSLIIGSGDGFTGKIISIISGPSPFIPVPGKGTARFQPLYVGDWVRCFLSALDDPEAAGRTYEIGGPEHITYNDMVKGIAAAMGVGKPLFHIPSGIAKLGIRVLEKTPFSPATSEQLRLLKEDNICEKDSVKRLFGFEPLRFERALGLFISRRGRDS